MSEEVFYSWVILPAIITCCRIADVTLGTMRILLITKGHRKIAPIVGFFEVLIWLFVMTQVIKHMDNVASYFAWATGFALGIYIGTWVEGKIALGVVIVRMFVSSETEPLIEQLRAQGYSVTVVDGYGSKGPVKLVYTITQRKKQAEVITIIGENAPDILYSVEDLKTAHADLLGPSSDAQSIRFGKWK